MLRTTDYTLDLGDTGHGGMILDQASLTHLEKPWLTAEQCGSRNLQNRGRETNASSSNSLTSIATDEMAVLDGKETERVPGKKRTRDAQESYDLGCGAKWTWDRQPKPRGCVARDQNT